LALLPKGTPQVTGVSEGVTPTGIPDITRATLRILPGNVVSLLMADGKDLKGTAQPGTDRVSFSIGLNKGASITGVLTVKVGEPYASTYVINDQAGRIFTVRQEYRSAQ